MARIAAIEIGQQDVPVARSRAKIPAPDYLDLDLSLCIVPREDVSVGGDPKQFAPVIRTYGRKLATLADQIAPQMRAAIKIAAAQTAWQELRDYARDRRA